MTGEGITMVNCEFSKACVYDFKILLGFLVNVILTFISGCSGGHKWVFMSMGAGLEVYIIILQLSHPLKQLL